MRTPINFVWGPLPLGVLGRWHRPERLRQRRPGFGCYPWRGGTAQSWLRAAFSFAMCQSYISAVPLLRRTSCNETYLRKIKAQLHLSLKYTRAAIRDGISCDPKKLNSRHCQRLDETDSSWLYLDFCFVFVFLGALAPVVTVHVNDSAHRQESRIGVEKYLTEKRSDPLWDRSTLTALISPSEYFLCLLLGLPLASFFILHPPLVLISTYATSAPSFRH